MRLPLRTASCLEDAPQSLRDFNNGVSLPFLSLVGPGMLPIRCKNAARLPLLPVLSGDLLMPYLFIIDLGFFFAVLAASLKFFAEGAPGEPTLRIFSPEPPAILCFFNRIFS